VIYPWDSLDLVLLCFFKVARGIGGVLDLVVQQQTPKPHF